MLAIWDAGLDAFFVSSVDSRVVLDKCDALHYAPIWRCSTQEIARVCVMIASMGKRLTEKNGPTAETL